MVTEDDLGALSEKDFDEVWVALGKVMGKIARARVQQRQMATMLPAQSGYESDAETDDEA